MALICSYVCRYFTCVCLFFCFRCVWPEMPLLPLLTMAKKQVFFPPTHTHKTYKTHTHTHTNTTTHHKKNTPPPPPHTHHHTHTTTPTHTHTQYTMPLC